MAFILKNASISLDGSDISQFVSEVQVEMVYEGVDVTGMGQGGGGRGRRSCCRAGPAASP